MRFAILRYSRDTRESRVIGYANAEHAPAALMRAYKRFGEDRDLFVRPASRKAPDGLHTVPRLVPR
jgi:hypothetical protein